MSSDKPSKLERLARSEVGEGVKHVGTGLLSVFGNAIHALGSLIHGTGRGVRGAGHWGGKVVETTGNVAGKTAYTAARFANYLSDRTAGAPRQEYVTIPVKKYRELLKLEPDEQYHELVQVARRHGDSVRIPVGEMPDLIAGLQQYSRHRHGYHSRYAVAAVLLLAALVLANASVTGAAVGAGVSASLATFLSFVLLFTAIFLFSRR